MIDALQIKNGSDKLDSSTDFALNLPTKPTCGWEGKSDGPWVDQVQVWESFDEHQDKHPCLWSTLSLLGFTWPVDYIFTVYRNHRHWFNPS